jgi:hypothetical protein
MYRSLIALIASMMIIGVAYAQSDEENKPRRDHRGPPAAALEACSSAVQGDACSFEGRHGEQLQGTCEAPEDKPLACRPEGGKPKEELERQ